MSGEHEVVRETVIDVLRRDLFGPYSGPDEEFDAGSADLRSRERPTTRYSTGILFPREKSEGIKKSLATDQKEDNGGLGGDSGQPPGEEDIGLSLSTTFSPSCCGMSFACHAATRTLRVSVSVGIYELHEAEGRKWKRRQIEGEKEIPVAKEYKVMPWIVCEGLEIRIQFRTPDKVGNLPITATLINTHLIDIDKIRDDKQDQGDEISKKSFFQCKLCIRGNEKGVFVERPRYDLERQSDEIKANELLHRHVRNFAAGHGCAATWECPEDHQCADLVAISFIPEADIYPMRPPPDKRMPEFNLKTISESTAKELQSIFKNIPKAYEDWLMKKKPDIKSVEAVFTEVALKQEDACRESLERVCEGITALSDPVVFRAFQLSQRAMYHVFVLSRWKKCNYEPSKGPLYDDTHSWFPFQIAFILQCLPSLADVENRYRNTADLLWFPTGGGKTEAYLALVAFAFFYRRLKASRQSGGGGGVSALMRYTLRLLTGDQFTRAATMVAACEKIRRETSDLRNTAPITIGLWVGNDETPGTIRKAKEIIDKLHAGGKVGSNEPNPVKLKNCPWCGTDLGECDYRIDAKSNSLTIKCPNAECEFKEGIPAMVVDEEIFRERPSLVVGTIDKFARIPWLEEAGALFSTDNQHLPPDLIIQDELHLISGPLGTISGLYEVAIDMLCHNGEKPPKIIASTATIRSAPAQTKALFNRSFSQFPPPLLDARDSFFAREDRTSPARRYVGVFAPAKSPLTAYIRTSACLLHGPEISGAKPNILDPYWTLIAYFNSLRELGGAVVRMQDDVDDHLTILATRDGLFPPRKRVCNNPEELTSRRSSAELDTIRKQLWTSVPDAETYDFVACSSMISVGLDVPRLGLMEVVGQPKTSAEYIQASSRIGRAHPGLVVIVYNPSRSRDRSHYERFVSYHGRLYAEVESTSVTPFSSRARDRALHAVLISVIRHKIGGMLKNNAAHDFVRDESVERVLEKIVERVRNIDPLEVDKTKAALDEIVSEWIRLGKMPALYYDRHKRANESLMVPFEESDSSSEGFRTLNNMRNVDVSAGMRLI